MADYAAEDAAYKAAREAEWGTWVASGPIHIGNALAFNDGDPVPASTVERFDLLAGSYVRRAGEPKPEVAVLVTSAPVGEPILLNGATETAPADLNLTDETSTGTPTDSTTKK